MIAEPPVDTPLLKVNPIEVAEVIVVFSSRLTGAAGTAKITAPVPVTDTTD